MQAFSTLHAMARAYAKAKIPVFPCEENGKRPATDRGFHDSTTDLEIIDAWWKENPNYNLALCPDHAGLFVVDIDPGAERQIIADLPPTYQVRTPRGGWHLYYKGSGPSTVGKIALHVDTRGQGGYVLVPPSVVDGKHLKKSSTDTYEDGKLYPYSAGEETEYSPIPDWVIKKLAVVDTPVAAAIDTMDLPVNIDRARKLLQRYVDKGDVAIEGQGGDDRTYRLCCELLDLGLSTPVAHDLIEEIWNPYCEPPWGPEELEIKLENASRFMQNEAGAYAVDDPKEVFKHAIKDVPATEKLSRFYFKDESEMEDEPDPQWIIKDLISERSTVMLYGPSGSYKSFLAMDICLSVAMGLPTFGSAVPKGLVFYGALEGRAHLKKARRAWRVLKGIEGKIDNFFLGVAPMIGVEGEMQEFGDEIAKRCAGRKPALIVIDTLSKSMAGLNENDAKDAGQFIRFCDSLVEAFGCSVMAIHHTGKEEGKGARGSSAFLAGFDTVLEVKAHKTTKAVAVYVRKHKDAEERETPWTFEGRITGPSLTFEPTTPEQHRLLIGESKDVTPKTVGAALKKLGAFGEPAGVTTAVLATELTPAKENESVEDRGAAIARTSRVLTTEAKGALEAYYTRQGKAYIWHLPAPV